MRDSKLYSTLKEFDKVDQNRFRKYLQSPYFNPNKTLIDLFEYLLDEINSGQEDEELDGEAIWQGLKLPPPFNDIRFRKYCSDLLKLLEEYMAQQVYDENTTYQSIFLMEAVGKKKLEKLFNSTLKMAQYNLEKHSYRNAMYFFSRYQVEKNYSNMIQVDLNRSSKGNVEEMVKNLDIFYLAEKLRLFYKMTARTNFSSNSYDFLFINEIAEFLKENEEHKSIPAISVPYQIYLIIKDPDNLDDYFTLKELLARFSLSFPQEEALDFYYSAINYCIRKINKGNQQFLSELFDLYRDLIEKEILFIDGELSPWTFKNIVVIALRLGNFEWVEKFINNYNQRIPEAYRENAITYNRATLYFYQKSYEKVIQLLQTIEYEDPAYNLDSKAMLLATYYEIDEVEPLYSLFESFRVYLNRKKDIPEDKKRLYKNLIKFTKRLTRIIPGDNKSVEKLKEEIAETKNIASVGWLKQKIAELEN